MFIEEFVEFFGTEITRVQIAECFVGTDGFDKRGRMDGSKAEFVFDRLGSTFGIGLGCNTGEKGRFLRFRFIRNEMNIKINDQMVLRFFLS